LRHKTQLSIFQDSAKKKHKIVMAETKNGEQTPSYEDLAKRVSELQKDLTLEKQRNSVINEELKRLRSANVALQAEVEQEEEFITNKLTKRLAELQGEKERLALEVELEEEFLTNTLQKKLDEVKRSKIDLENQLEQEQEYITNKLQTQLEKVTTEKNELERILEETSVALVDRLIERLKGEPSGPISASLEVAEDRLIQRLAKETDVLRGKSKKFDHEITNLKESNERLEMDLARLQSENLHLSQQIGREKEKGDSMRTSIARLEVEHAGEEEKRISSSRRHSSTHVLSPRATRSSSTDGVDQPFGLTKSSSGSSRTHSHKADDVAHHHDSPSSSVQSSLGSASPSASHRLSVDSGSFLTPPTG